MASKTYIYHSFDSKGKDTTNSVVLSDELEGKAEQAVKRYETSKSWIHKKYVYIWMFAHKSYSLSTEDRAKYINTWQSNVAFGLIRSFIDVFVSTLTERPINFRVQ